MGLGWRALLRACWGYQSIEVYRKYIIIESGPGLRTSFTRIPPRLWVTKIMGRYERNFSCLYNARGRDGFQTSGSSALI